MLHWLDKERESIEWSHKEWTGTRWILRDRKALGEIRIVDAIRSRLERELRARARSRP